MERLSYPMNKTQAEVLTILQEECAELIQAISKVFRHGEDSSNPYDKNPVTNREHMRQEMADVSTLMSLAMFAYGISHAELKAGTARKVESLQKYSKVFEKITTEYTVEEFQTFFADFLNTVSESADKVLKTPRKRKVEKVPKNELN
jgi:NTP pyrophosphatase (non-canonical NTP hydrolase)